jgi:hypothetical protein
MGYWALFRDGICLLNLEAVPQPAIEFFNLSTHRMVRLVRLDRSKVPFGAAVLDVSQDGQWIIFWQVDQFETEIMLVENFL